MPHVIYKAADSYTWLRKKSNKKTIFRWLVWEPRFLPATKSVPKEIMTLVRSPRCAIRPSTKPRGGIKREFHLCHIPAGKGALGRYFGPLSRAGNQRSSAPRAKTELLEILKTPIWIWCHAPISASTKALLIRATPYGCARRLIGQRTLCG